MEDSKVIKIKTNALIQLIDAFSGEILEESRVHNIVVNVGLDEVAHLIAGISSPVAFGYMALGTSATSPSAGQTALGTEVKRSSVTATDAGVGILTYDKTFTFNSGESYTITEYGLFNDVSSGEMLNRLTDGGHAVDVNNNLRVIITITVSNSLFFIRGVLIWHIKF